MQHLHRVPGDLLTGPVRVLVVGCGGNGGAVACGLPSLHKTLIARGHPHGLHCVLMDGDEVSLANTQSGRQPFHAGDVGHNKAKILASRLNLFHGLRWGAYPHFLQPKHDLANYYDIVIGCVDSHKARRVIAQVCQSSRVAYWLDLGNNADVGQFVLGQPINRRNSKEDPARLLTAPERYPEMLDTKLPERNEPSCSAAEAVSRQLPFLNQTLAQLSLSLLERLFAVGIEHHGAVVRLTPGEAGTRMVTAIPIPPPVAPEPPAPPAEGKGARARRRRKAAAIAEVG
ncbi:MAG TPA: PRTRC system ThiF family protein [Longimicrobium sp.]|nr:PRTRC system ThiF family protein [Longimicrobium sp.]